MIRLTAIAKEDCPNAPALLLDYDQRQHSRLRVSLEDGGEVAIILSRGSTLRDGDCLCGSDGTIVRIRAATEAVSTVMIADPRLLATAAYHLGNRHEPLQVGANWLRYRRDHVLDAMMLEQGFEPCHEEAPFEPERGAYGHHGQGRAEPIFAEAPSAVMLPTVVMSGGQDDPVAMLLQLLRLASPALPIGGFAYSQGLEQAVEFGWVRDEAAMVDWLRGLMGEVQARQDLPLFARLYRAWAAGDSACVDEWNACVIALRETAELRAEECHTGASLARLLTDLDAGLHSAAMGDIPPGQGYLSMFALAAARWGIPLREAATGLMWAWCQNQVAAAVRLVPLGQTAGQRILQQLSAEIPAHVDHGLLVEDDAIGFSVPGLAFASACHEQQYTRLFLS